MTEAPNGCAQSFPTGFQVHADYTIAANVLPSLVSCFTIPRPCRKDFNVHSRPSIKIVACFLPMYRA